MAAPSVQAPLLSARLGARMQRWRSWAPPIRRVEFWIVQVLVLVIAAGHSYIELAHGVHLGPVEFLPVSLYLLPVLYSALTFGLRGSVPTAFWCAVLTLPNTLFYHHGAEQLAELWQAGLVVVVGFYAGWRADRERQLRHEAERRERERQVSEEKYRGLFESAADAILLVDGGGRVQEANAAAATLLNVSPDAIRGRRLGELAPPDLAECLQAESPERVVGPLDVDGGGRTVWIEPVCLDLRTSPGGERRLIQLRDVTMQVARQQMLESYARQTIDAREAERRRVARELHDGPLQSLMLLWQALDRLEQAPGDSDGRSLAEARRTAESVADELRRFSRDLRPSVLDDLGLTAALKAEASGLEQRSGVSVSFRHSGMDRRVPPEIELALLRIGQEALRNVERHAHARNVSVRLTHGASEVHLVVTDDGRGLQPVLPAATELLASGKLGIVGMQERARLVGATCAIRQGTRRGTTIEVIAPLRPAGIPA